MLPHKGTGSKKVVQTTEREVLQKSVSKLATRLPPCVLPSPVVAIAAFASRCRVAHAGGTKNVLRNPKTPLEPCDGVLAVGFWEGSIGINSLGLVSDLLLTVHVWDAWERSGNITEKSRGMPGTV